MLAGSAREYLERFGVLAGSRAVLLTTNDAGYAAAAALAAAGPGARGGRRPAPRGPCGARRRRAPARRGGVRRRGRAARHRRGGRRPRDRLRPAARGRWLEPGRPPAQPGAGQRALGRGRGRVRPRRRAGRLARRRRGDRHLRPRRVRRAGRRRGRGRDRRRVAGRRRHARRRRSPRTLLWSVPPPAGRGEDDCFVDQQRDATVADVRRAAAAGLRSPEHVKRFTTIGTANDQGRTSGVLTLGVMAELLEQPLDALGPTTFRPPFTPVSFALLAGPDRGRPVRPVRTTTIHAWHVDARGGVRGRRPVEAAVVLPARGRGHGRRRPARVRRRARRAWR